MKPSLYDIDNLLPQTQCGQCGHGGCLPYAQAMLDGAPHNQCPPGGTRVINQLSQLLNRKPLDLNPDNGIEGPWELAFIRESDCIGCTKCIQACPVDAIVGSGKLMHTVLTDLCTGCGLCVAPCPVDCIDMVINPKQPSDLSNADFYAQAHESRDRMKSRELRLKKLADQKKRKHALHKAQIINPEQTQEEKIVFIQEALLRALEKNKK